MRGSLMGVDGMVVEYASGGQGDFRSRMMGCKQGWGIVS